MVDHVVEKVDHVVDFCANKTTFVVVCCTVFKVLKYGINGKPPSCCGTLREINWVDQAVTAAAAGRLPIDPPN